MSVEGRPLDEQKLIASSREGDTRAFAELVRIHSPLALRVAYLVVRDETEAEDVTQDALIKAYRSLGRFRVGSPFRPWLLRIVRNEALNRVRGTRRRENLALRLAADPVSRDAAPSPETAAIARIDRGRLLEVVNSMDDKYRSVVVHRYLLELTEKETAAILGIPVGTVKSRTARGLEQLEGALSDIGGFE